jgi:hypothetical protein
MNEQLFYQTINTKAKELAINPLLLLSGIEGLYTFKDVELSAINYEFLDSLILTIFALRIGDQFHALAQENLSSTNTHVQLAAINEIMELSNEEISNSADPYFRSFATILNGKSVIRRYHKKAIEVAALEVNNAQKQFNNSSIGAIVLAICKTDLNNDLGLADLFI